MVYLVAVMVVAVIDSVGTSVCACVHVTMYSGGCEEVIPVNQLHSIKLDTSRAGPGGHVTCDVIPETGSVIHADDTAGPSGDVRELTYRPTVTETHHVYLYYGGQPIPGGHFLQQVRHMDR